MRDTAHTDEHPTAMKIAFDRAGFHRAVPGVTAIPVALERPTRPDRGPSYADMAAGFLGNTSTAAVCDNLASFGGAPDRDEPDPREIWDGEEALYALSQAISIMVAGVTIEGTQLEDEREPLLWGLVNLFHRQMERLDRTVHKLEPEMRELERAQDGTEIPALQLQRVTERAQSLGARSEAFHTLRDLAADAYRHHTGDAWRPRGGSFVPRGSHLTSAAIDARDFLRARKNRESEAHMPDGTLIAVAGGKDVHNPDRILSVLEQAREKYQDMVLVHGAAPGYEKIAASWADTHGIQQIVCRPDWKAHGRAAPFRRNDALLNLLPKGVIAFPGTGVTENLVDKARQLGIPVHRIGA